MISFVLLFVHSFSLGLTNIFPSQPGSDSSNSAQNQTFKILPHTSYGSCKCDVSNNCDPYCCCDPDCNGVSFPYCVDQIEDINANNPSLRMCSDPEPAENGKIIDWFLRSSLCIYTKNNPSPGDFYDIDAYQNSDSEPTDFSKLFSDSNTAISQSDQTDVTIPRLGPDGKCVNKPLQYLEHVDEYCVNGTGGQINDYSVDAGNCTNITCVGEKLNGTYPNSTLHVTVRWGNSQPSRASLKGYSYGEEIKSGNETIDLAQLCSNATHIYLQFGMSTTYECDVNDSNLLQAVSRDNQTDQFLFFNNSSITFQYNNYSISPNENVDDNIGAVHQVYPEGGLNCTSEISNPSIPYIVQSIIVIYKSVGKKSSPQRIISDMQVRYQASLTDIQYNVKLGFNESGYDNRSSPKLKINIHFYEAPNDVNSFNDPSKGDIYNWLPF